MDENNQFKIEMARVPAGTTFKYGFKEFTIKSAKVVYGKVQLRTDKQTFVKDLFQFQYFLDEIVIIDKNKKMEKQNNNQLEMVKQITVYDAEIMTSSNNCNKISSSLMAMFEAVEASASPENMKKAEIMVKLSNAMVINETAKFKFLNSLQ